MLYCTVSMRKTISKGKVSAKDSFFKRVMAELRSTGLYSEIFLKHLEKKLKSSGYYKAYQTGALGAIE